MEQFFSIQNMNITQYIACINTWLSEKENIIPERICVGEFLPDSCGNKKESPELTLVYNEGDASAKEYALSYFEKESFLKIGLDEMLSLWCKEYPHIKVVLSSYFHGVDKKTDGSSEDLYAPDSNRLWVLYEKTADSVAEDVITDKAILKERDNPPAEDTENLQEEYSERRFCPECGTPTVPEALYCAECGYKLEFDF